MNAKLVRIGVATLSLLPLGSEAADNCSGHYVNVGQSAEVTDLGNGNSLVVFKNTSVNITDDKTSPLYMTVGDCVGTALTQGKTTAASGRCSRKDKDGDVYSYEWSLPSGEEKGTWNFVGGTGKYANAKWSGWWQQTMADGKTVGGVWGGSCR
jgi:hypothetical protein